MRRVTLVKLLLGSALVVGVTNPLAAQEQRVANWVGGPINGDWAQGCMFTRPVVASIDVQVLLLPDAYAPVLRIRNADWQLQDDALIDIDVNLNGATSAYRAQQVEAPNIAEVVFDGDESFEVATFLRQSKLLTLRTGGRSYGVDLDDAPQMVDALQACAAGETIAANKSPAKDKTRDALSAAYASLSEVIVAGYTCAITAAEMYGVVYNRRQAQAEQVYTLDLLADGALLLDGNRVEPAHQEFAADDPQQLVGASFDVRALLQAGQAGQAQLPATYGDDANEFAEIMQWYTGLTANALLGDRSRWMIINTEADIIAFTDFDADGQLTNTVAPQCFRTR